MATFNGIDLGIVEEWATTAAPKARQLNAYPGVDGLESLDLGGRGGTTALRAVIVAADAYSLASVKNGFIAMQADGGAYTFVDPEGTAWPDVILAMFQPVGPRIPVDSAGTIAQRYELTMLHLD